MKSYLQRLKPIDWLVIALIFLTISNGILAVSAVSAAWLRHKTSKKDIPRLLVTPRG